MLQGCSDDHLPWSRNATTSQLDTKYPYVVHAEVNAILNKCSKDVRGATLYVALFPCNECAKMIIQAGISEVVYVNDMVRWMLLFERGLPFFLPLFSICFCFFRYPKYHDTDACRASRIMFQMAGIKTRQYNPTIQHIQIRLSPEDTAPSAVGLSRTHDESFM